METRIKAITLGYCIKTTDPSKHILLLFFQAVNSLKKLLLSRQNMFFRYFFFWFIVTRSSLRALGHILKKEQDSSFPRINISSEQYLSYVMFFFLSLFLTQSPFAQKNITQTVRGTVVDESSRSPLSFVSIYLITEDSTELTGLSQEDGSFKIDYVPTGRHSIEFTYIGYQSVFISDLIVTSGKEVVLNISMNLSSKKLKEVTITARRNGEVRNQMAMVSAREFSVSETNRYAGSRGEPARMASNFAGVQGADDSRNDIVIRGNSPQGVLWKLEDITIPNPNHFSIPGTSGGPVTILNNKFLTNSDFYTGAFPAEYADGLAGVFDLNMRNGNNEKHEFSFQLGFLGTEAMAEGPINRNKKSSYLATYRYSTLQLFSFLNIRLGTEAIPSYQDGALRLHFPTKGGGKFSIFGIAGDSDIDIVISEQTAPSESNIYGENTRDQYFGSRMFVGGACFSKPLSSSSFFKVAAAASQQFVDVTHDLIYRHTEDGRFVVDSLPMILDYEFKTNKYSFVSYYNKRFSPAFTMKTGLQADLYQHNFIDSARAILVANPGDPVKLGQFRTRWNAQVTPAQIAPYVQFKYKASEKLNITGGITANYYSLNKNSLSPIEPRLGASYQLHEKHKLSIGLGLHSQRQPDYLYFYSNQTIGSQPIEYNRDLGLSKSAQSVLSYNWNTSKYSRIKIETYYQHLFDIPVSVIPSAFSFVNTGSGFSRFFPDELANEGIGRNYGLEITVEKFFHNHYYYLFTGSVFDSKYQGSDGIWRNTTFNGKFAFNALFAYEFELGENLTLNTGAKATLIGGKWYGEVDEVKSAQQLEVIFVDETYNTKQFRPYFRVDGKLDITWNRPKVTHEFAVDLINVFNIKNILALTYLPNPPEGTSNVQEEYQLGFLPIFYYKLDF